MRVHTCRVTSPCLTCKGKQEKRGPENTDAGQRPQPDDPTSAWSVLGGSSSGFLALAVPRVGDIVLAAIDMTSTLTRAPP